MAQEWLLDVLGEGFEQQTLPLGEDEQGPVVATVVRHLPKQFLGITTGPLRDVDVLYVHGWSDYFFQKQLAEFWTSKGARFYGLDLRKYGRSLREGQTAGYITDLATYDEDIAAALAAMGRTVEGPNERRLVLMGHSTGGLTLSLWAGRHPDAVSAVILNSPWLEFQLSAATRAAIAPVLGFHSRIRPMDDWPQVDLGFYARAQRLVAEPDDTEVNPAWRPDQTMPVHVGWMNAVIAGHAKVASGVGIKVPVCVLLSARTIVPTKWTEELTSVDSVLIVDDIARASLKLGSSVMIERINGALHDVFLSKHEVRVDAYARLERWVDAFIAKR